jgi:preprotein translocase subunit YajC
MSLVFLVATMFAIWYFLVLRPQARQAREHGAMISALKKGDSVVTHAGIHGRIWAVEDRVFQLEVARGVRIRVDKDKIARTEQAAAEPEAADGKASGEKQ